MKKSTARLTLPWKTETNPHPTMMLSQMNEHTKCLGIPTPLHANKRLHLVGAARIGRSSISLSRRARSTSTKPHLGRLKAVVNITFPSTPEKDFAPTTGLKRLLCSPATCEAEEEVCLNLVCLFSCCCGRDTNPTPFPLSHHLLLPSCHCHC